MKKFIIVLSLIFMMNVLVCAEHLKFMDIPINGTLENYEKELLKNGFMPDEDTTENSDLEKWYVGRWGGEDVVLCVNLSPKTKNVYGLAVVLDNQFEEDEELMKLAQMIGTVRSLYQVDETDIKDEMTRYYVNDGQGIIGVGFEHGNIVVYFLDVENTGTANAEELELDEGM